MSEATVIEARPGTSAGQESGDGETKTRKTRTTKPQHPAVLAGKISAVPEGYSTAKYAGLKEDDFEPGKVDVFYDWQAKNFERKANALRGKAESFRKLGGFTDKKTAKKLADVYSEAKMLLEKMAAQGENIGDLQQMLLALAGGAAPVEGAEAAA